MPIQRPLLLISGLLLSNICNGGTLLSAVHHSVFSLSSGSSKVRMWLPLARDYATQVPLSVSVSLEPAHLGSIHYEKDGVGNWGAWIDFQHSTNAATATLHAESLVFAQDVLPEDRAEFYDNLDSPAQWTHPTPVVNAEYAPVKKLAVALTQGASNSYDAISSIQKWVSSNIKYQFPGALDSTSTFDKRLSTCTGYANLAAALGRAAGIPSKTIAGYLVGGPQQTHSVNEFYLWHGAGWWRIEPQASYSWLPENYMVVVRVNLESAEQNAAMVHPMRPGNAAPGVPVFSLVELQGETSRVVMRNSNFFQNCPSCDNSATRLKELGGAHNDSKRLFYRARSLWQRDLRHILGGSLSQGVSDQRKQAYKISSLADLDQTLTELEKAPR